jgi:hypothetical protein
LRPSSTSEGAALGVLPGEADAGAGGGEAGEGKGFGRGPVEGALALSHLAAQLQDLLHLGMGMEVCREAGQALHEAAQPFGGNARVHVLDRTLEAAGYVLPGAAGALLLARVLLAARLGELHLQLLGALGGDAVGLLAGDAAELEEMFEVPFAHALAAFDDAVQQGLGEAGLVALVMAAAAVAVHVDDHVAMEGFPEVHGQVDHGGHRLRILPVHVEDRDLQHLGHVGGVGGGAGLGRTGGEADLVVEHHVQGSARAVAGQLAHVEDLLHQALADEGGRG